MPGSSVSDRYRESYRKLIWLVWARGSVEYGPFSGGGNAIEEVERGPVAGGSGGSAWKR